MKVGTSRPRNAKVKPSPNPGDAHAEGLGASREGGAGESVASVEDDEEGDEETKEEASGDAEVSG